MSDLRTLLEDLPQGTVRIEVQHHLRRRFRWLFLLEVLLSLLTCLCLVPLVLLLAVAAEDTPDFDLERLWGRRWHRWHGVEVVFQARGATELGRVHLDPLDEEAGDGVLAAVLQAANQAGLVVVETLASEVLATFFGGRPALASPVAVDAGAAARTLTGSGAVVTRSAEGLEVSLSDRRRNRFAAGLGVVVGLPLTGWTRAGRAGLAQGLLDALGTPPGALMIAVDSDALRVRRVRGDTESWALTAARSEWLGVVWGPTLGYAPVVRRRAQLRVVTRAGTVRLDPGRDPGLGPPLRDLLWAAAAGLEPGSEDRASHCPFCGTLYPFVPGCRCPSCGAPPVDLKSTW